MTSFCCSCLKFCWKWDFQEFYAAIFRWKLDFPGVTNRYIRTLTACCTTKTLSDIHRNTFGPNIYSYVAVVGCFSCPSYTFGSLFHCSFLNSLDFEQKKKKKTYLVVFSTVDLFLVWVHKSASFWDSFLHWNFQIITSTSVKHIIFC